MDMQGEIRIPAPRETVWDALNDPEVLKACIKGCQSLERDEDGGFEATVKAKVGPVSAVFKGAVKLENINAPESYTIVGEGKGGAAGFAKGGADVSLAEDGGETILTYKVDAQVGGKMAQIGARLIDSTAKKYANDFFEKFSEAVAARAPAAESGPGDDTAAEATPDIDPPSPGPATVSVEEPAPDPIPEGEAPPEATPDLKAEATQAAVEATKDIKAKRGFGPFTWVLIIILIGLGASLLNIF